MIYVAVTCYRGMRDENNEQFVAYFVPTKETLRKRQQDTQDSVSYQEGEEYVLHDTQITCAYNYNVM